MTTAAVRARHIEEPVGIGDALRVRILFLVGKANEFPWLQCGAVDREELCVFLFIVGDQTRAEFWCRRHTGRAAEIHTHLIAYSIVPLILNEARSCHPRDRLTPNTR